MDQNLLFNVVDLPEVMTGGADERRRRAAEIGHGEDDPKPRVGPRDADLHPIHPEVCGGHAVDEKDRSNVSDLNFNGRN